VVRDGDVVVRWLGVGAVRDRVLGSQHSISLRDREYGVSGCGTVRGRSQERQENYCSISGK
jgi:hypothetical protein